MVVWATRTGVLLVKTRRGAFVTAAILGCGLALVIGAAFSVAGLIGVVCGGIAQQLADESRLAGRGGSGAVEEPSDRNGKP